MTTNRSFSSTTQGLPSCTVIIPTRNQLALLKRCIEGVLSSQYDGELEIIIVDNQSDDRRTLSYLDSILANARVRVIPWNEPFNFSRINNMAASQAKGEVLCFLNNDIEILSPQWLEQLVSIAHEEGVGAVGATLLYPDRSVQHAGVALDEDWIGLHIAQHQTFTTLAEQYQLNRLYPMNAVTAACMVTKASTFQKLGGFNEKDLQVSFNDVDYCLRLQELGLPVLLYPGVQLLHHESATRKSDDLPENRPRAMREKEFMRTRWGNILQEKHYTGDIPFSQIMAEDRPALFDIESLRVQIARERAKLLSTPLQSSVASKSSLKVDETDIDSWEDKYRLLELEYRALESYTRSIKSELDLILASRSWRLTSGLRTFVRWATDTKHRLGRLVVSHPAGRGLYELLRGKRAPTQQEQSTPHSTNDFKENFFKQAAAGFEKFLASNELLEFPNGETPQVSIILIFYNQAPLSLLCLRSIIEKSDVPIELVIIDNASSDKTDQLLSRCRNARIVRNKDNKGFVEAVNQGAALCNGKHILLLNNDTMLQDHSLSRAVQTLESEPDAGAVGAKIVLLDGTLQEAGSIIWQDASCLGYGRGQHPEQPEFMYRRDVDYCSGAFLLFPRQLFEQLGGFDLDYAPAYYEESDFCVRLQKQGYRIIYEPESVIVHYEFASSGGFEGASKLQIAHREILRQKHGDYLADKYPSKENNILSARTARKRRRVLVIDDRVPHVELGAGYPRCRHIMQELALLDCDITFYPLRTSYDEWEDTYRTLPKTIEVMLYLGKDQLEEFLESRKDFYDDILISRSHNMDLFSTIAHRKPRLVGHSRIIYDAEAVTAKRDVMQMHLSGKKISTERERELIQNEIALAKSASTIICVSESEADLYRSSGFKDVVVLGHQVEIAAGSKSFNERIDFLFVGALRDDNSPNVDSILWFEREIVPELERLCHAEFSVLVVGDNTAPALRKITNKRIRFLGKQKDISALYLRSRVFIAPTRFAAGIPHKVHESAAYGVPVVCTSLLASQLGWHDKQELLVADTPEDFAKQCAQLYEDKLLWETIQKKALEAVARDCSNATFREQIRRLFD